MVIYDVHNIPDNPKANEFSDNLFKNVNAMSGDAYTLSLWKLISKSC